jgi:hypothetical protein
MGWPGLSRLKHSTEQNSVNREKIGTAQYHNQHLCKITHQLYYPEKMRIYKCCNMRMLNFQQKYSWTLEKLNLQIIINFMQTSIPNCLFKIYSLLPQQNVHKVKNDQIHALVLQNSCLYTTLILNWITHSKEIIAPTTSSKIPLL